MNIKQITPLNSSRPSQWRAPFQKVWTFLLSAYKKEANLSVSSLLNILNKYNINYQIQTVDNNVRQDSSLAKISIVFTTTPLGK